MAMVTRAAPPRRTGPLVVGLTPEQFILWLQGRLKYAYTAAGERVKLARGWSAGVHMALIGKTGEGKTNFFVWVAQVRNFVMALDPKGEDDSLQASGWTRITQIPPPGKILNRVAEGGPVRLIVGGASTTEREDLALVKLLRRTLEYIRGSGGWTIYVDEFQVLADQRMFGLGILVERLLITARRMRTSVVTAYQAPAWVPKASTRQAGIIVVWKTGDRDMVKTVASAAGRDWRDVAAALDELPMFHVLVIPDDLRSPMMIVKPPKVT